MGFGGFGGGFGDRFGDMLNCLPKQFTMSPNSDGQTILTGSWKKAQLWKPPAPLAGDVERIVLWTQVITGMELHADGVTRVLDAATWEQRRRRLEEFGGPP